MTWLLFSPYSGARTDDHRPHRSQQQMDSANASSPGPAEAAPPVAAGLAVVAIVAGLLVLFGTRRHDSAADSGTSTPKPSVKPSTVAAGLPKSTASSPTTEPSNEPTTAPPATQPPATQPTMPSADRP